MSIHDPCTVRYEFVGGPMDGDKVTVQGDDPIRDGMIYEVLVEGTFLYRSYGPVRASDGVIVLGYVGNVAHKPWEERPGVHQMSW